MTRNGSIRSSVGAGAPAGRCRLWPGTLVAAVLAQAERRGRARRYNRPRRCHMTRRLLPLITLLAGLLLGPTVAALVVPRPTAARAPEPAPDPAIEYVGWGQQNWGPGVTA